MVRGQVKQHTPSTSSVFPPFGRAACQRVTQHRLHHTNFSEEALRQDRSRLLDRRMEAPLEPDHRH